MVLSNCVCVCVIDLNKLTSRFFFVDNVLRNRVIQGGLLGKIQVFDVSGRKDCMKNKYWECKVGGGRLSLQHALWSIHSLSWWQTKNRTSNMPTAAILREQRVPVSSSSERQTKRLWVAGPLLELRQASPFCPTQRLAGTLLKSGQISHHKRSTTHFRASAWKWSSLSYKTNDSKQLWKQKKVSLLWTDFCSLSFQNKPMVVKGACSFDACTIILY